MMGIVDLVAVTWFDLDDVWDSMSDYGKEDYRNDAANFIVGLKAAGYEIVHRYGAVHDGLVPPNY